METWPVSTYVTVDLRPRAEYLRRPSEIPFLQEKRANAPPSAVEQTSTCHARCLEQPELVGRRRRRVVLDGSRGRRRIVDLARAVELGRGRRIVELERGRRIVEAALRRLRRSA